MSSPEKKKKRKKKPSQILLPMPGTTPNPSLPDDLLVSCFARLSRLYYPTLSLVSKSFRSLIASPELYETRLSLNHIESYLYVCLRISGNNCSWFTLCLRPDKTLTNTTGKKKKKSSGYVLAAIPNPHPNCHEANGKGMVALGSNIYNFGGPIENKPSSCVSILDCRYNTWHEAPRMQVEREYASASIFDGKIYVAGGGRECNSSNWMEVFDPETQAWDLVSGPGAKIWGSYNVKKSVVTDAKIIHVFGNGNCLAYKPKEGKWEKVRWEVDAGWVWYSYCVIENVVYHYDDGEFKWYDTKVRRSRNLKGVKGLPRFARYGIRFADYVGKIAVLWEKTLASSGYKDKMILCAVIALERRNSKEIWGNVEWHGEVLTVPKSWGLESALAVTV